MLYFLPRCAQILAERPRKKGIAIIQSKPWSQAGGGLEGAFGILSIIEWGRESEKVIVQFSAPNMAFVKVQQY